VAHTCNPSYSGGRDQEGRGSKQPGQIVYETLSRKAHHKKVLVEWLKVKALNSSPSTAKTKKNYSKTNQRNTLYDFNLKMKAAGKFYLLFLTKLKI
jgi:hypothetical protein